MNAKKTLRCLLLGSAILFSGNAMAELRLAVVDSIKALDAALKATAAEQRLKQEFAGRRNKLVAAENGLKQKEERLARDRMAMSATEQEKQEREITAARRDFQRDQAEFRDDVNLRRNEELRKAQRQVTEAIRTVAKDQNFDVIIGEGVYYASERVDITDEVVKRLKAQR